MPKLQKATKTALTGNRTAKPVISETLHFEYNTEFTELSDINYFTSTAMEIKRCFRQALEEYIKIGKKLKEAKEKIKTGLVNNEMKFLRWVSVEFGDMFSIDTAQSYMNLASMEERFGLEELKQQQEHKRLSNTSLALLGRKTTPEGVIQLIFNSDVPLTHREIKKLVSHVKSFKPESINETTTELIFEILPKKRSTRLLTSTESTTESTIDVECRPCASELLSAVHLINNSIVERADSWINVVDNLTDMSTDVCIADFSLQSSDLGLYSLLTEKLYPKMKDGGVLLIPVGHQALPFIGNYINSFNIGWIFSIKRKKVVNNLNGGITIQSGWIPLLMLQKPHEQQREVVINDTTPCLQISKSEFSATFKQYVIKLGLATNNVLYLNTSNTSDTTLGLNTEFMTSILESNNSRRIHNSQNN
jgi:hypothetical protein